MPLEIVALEDDEEPISSSEIDMCYIVRRIGHYLELVPILSHLVVSQGF
jgi:hypothetical protein